MKNNNSAHLHSKNVENRSSSDFSRRRQFDGSSGGPQRACHICGSFDHLKYQCPEILNVQRPAAVGLKHSPGPSRHVAFAAPPNGVSAYTRPNIGPNMKSSSSYSP